MANPADTFLKKSNWFIRHWRGEIPLAQSFLINFVLLPVMITWGLHFAVPEILKAIANPLFEICVQGGKIVVLVTTVIWATVGVWRSSGRAKLAGRKVPVILVRVYVILNIILGVSVPIVHYQIGKVQQRLADNVRETNEQYESFQNQIDEGQPIESGNPFSTKAEKYASAAIADDLRDIQQKAEQGDRDAQYKLGTRYDSGVGAPQNLAEANKWYMKAAENGQAEAQSAIGMGYYKGIGGFPKDRGKAISWWKKAAEASNVDAQYNLGTAYSEKGAKPQDIAEARKWFQKAAAQGDQGAEDALKTLAK